MNELILKVEQWAQDRNLINGCNPIDQAMKLFSEAGELADNIGKGADIKDDVGDTLVVLIVLAAQLGYSLAEINFKNLVWADGKNKELVLVLFNTLPELVGYAHNASFFHVGLFKRAINTLNAIARNHKTTLQECLRVAYDDIKDRKGIMQNGTFIKSTDPLYEKIVKQIEGNCNA